MSEISNNNPLTKFFRQPAIYLKLPSNGAFWPNDAIELPLTGEIPVYPLTTKDEIILRTPDALLNGEGVVEVIQSCCPSIKDAWQTPSVDVDAILIAIRIASYGSNFEQDTKCPHCNEENSYTIALSPILDGIKCPNYNKISVRDLTFKLKPQRFFGINRINTIEFEEDKIRQALALPDTDAEIKSKELTRSIERLIDLSIETVASGIDYIELPDGSIVKEKEHIFEFLQNAESIFVTEVQKVLTNLSQETAIKPAVVKCGHCEQDYQIPLMFDYSNFFVVGS